MDVTNCTNFGIFETRTFCKNCQKAKRKFDNFHFFLIFWHVDISDYLKF